MSFANQPFLWALPLGLIPIIIYYLMRYRSLKVIWGANYVLERALERLKKRMYLEELLLLLLRVLACLAIVIAFARPRASDKSAMVWGSGVHHVVVLDGSYSMLAGEATKTRWDRAKQTLKSLVGTWGRGETWSLCLLTEKPKWVVDSAPVESAERTAELVDSLAISECAIALSTELEKVVGKFAAGKADFYVLADDQESTWKGMDKVVLPVEQKRKIYWVNPPLEDRRNLAVTAVRVSSDKVLREHPCRVFVAVHNFGPQPAKDVEVELLVDGTFFGKESISLLPGQENWIHLDLLFETPGSHYVTARLGKDILAFDNQLSAGVEVVEQLQVLVLRDAAKRKKFDSAWGFLEVVGRVEQTVDLDDERIFKMGPLTFSLCEDECENGTLAKADVVFVDAGRTLTAELVSGLRKYVGQGGGLVLAPDVTVEPSRWNELLEKEGLLPAKLLRPRREMLNSPRFQTVSKSEFGGAALRAFETDEDGDLNNARFYSWFEFAEVPKETVTLASFGDRQPFLLKKRFPAGCVLLLAAGLNGGDNNLIVREFFLPLLYRIFPEAASGSVFPRTVGRGDPIALRVTDPSTVKAITFSADEKEPIALTASETPAGHVVRVPGGSAQSGLCSIMVIRPDGWSRVWYGVQGPRVDSDLAPLEPAAKTRMMTRLGIVEAADWNQLDAILKAERSGKEWHHWVIIALVAILVGEMMLARRFL